VWASAPGLALHVAPVVAVPLPRSGERAQSTVYKFGDRYRRLEPGTDLAP
jgi:hypothetical protein